MNGSAPGASLSTLPKPLVFVPGFPGSAIEDLQRNLELFPNLAALLDTTMRPILVQRLSGPDDLTANDGVAAGEPIRSVSRLLAVPFLDLVGSIKQAQSLYDILQGFGYGGFSKPYGARFRPVGWDWRRPVDDPAARGAIAAAVGELYAGTQEPVTIVCHSTGGLVVRAALEGAPELAGKVERVIALAVPWVGTLQSLPYLLAQQAFSPFTVTETQSIVAHSWAAFDLLPPDTATVQMTDGEGDLDLFTAAGKQSSPLVATGWMNDVAAGANLAAMQARAASARTRLGNRQRTLSVGGREIEVVMVVGFGGSTATGSAMDAQGKVSFAFSDDGDGTIPRRSAAWLGGGSARAFYVPIGHYQDSQLERVHICIWENSPVQAILGTLLARRPWQPYTYAVVDADDAINDVQQVRVRLVAQDQGGSPLSGAIAQAGGLAGAAPPPTLVDQGTGRGLMMVDREDIVTAVGNGWHRFTVQFHWREGGQDRSGDPQALLVQKPG